MKDLEKAISQYNKSWGVTQEEAWCAEGKEKGLEYDPHWEHWDFYG